MFFQFHWIEQQLSHCERPLCWVQRLFQTENLDYNIKHLHSHLLIQCTIHACHCYSEELHTVLFNVSAKMIHIILAHTLRINNLHSTANMLADKCGLFRSWCWCLQPLLMCNVRHAFITAEYSWYAMLILLTKCLFIRRAVQIDACLFVRRTSPYK